MDFTSCVMVAAPKECPANIIFPALCTSIRSLKGESEEEEVLRFVRLVLPRSSLSKLSCIKPNSQSRILS